jgi:hypothetical protein
MVSDTLSDAAASIRDYLNDPVFDNVYENETRLEIESLCVLMDMVRRKLDMPPNRAA